MSATLSLYRVMMLTHRLQHYDTFDIHASDATEAISQASKGAPEYVTFGVAVEIDETNRALSGYPVARPIVHEKETA